MALRLAVFVAIEFRGRLVALCRVGVEIAAAALGTVAIRVAIAAEGDNMAGGATEAIVTGGVRCS